MYLENMPNPAEPFVGRQRQLAGLLAAWRDDDTGLLTLTGTEGVGKTQIVAHWLRRVSAGTGLDDRAVFTWSFQRGTVSTFLTNALTWLDDPAPEAGSGLERSERLVDRLRARPALLVLDAVDAAPAAGQSTLFGELIDECIVVLVRELSFYNPGLCVLTARWNKVSGCARRIRIRGLPRTEGAALLRTELGPACSELELEGISEKLGGHPAALLHYARTLARQGRSRQTAETDGAASLPLVDSLGQELSGTPEFAILELLSLFDGSAMPKTIQRLLDLPALAQLGSVPPVRSARWKRAVANLRGAGLLLPLRQRCPAQLEVQPEVRHFFGCELRERWPNLWRESHAQLARADGS